MDPTQRAVDDGRSLGDDVGDDAGDEAGEALTMAVAEVEDFVAAVGWDAPRRLFALVDTAALLATEPGLTGSIDAGSRYTPIAQDEMPGDELVDALAGVSWPDEVAGCVLALGILGSGTPGDAEGELPEMTAEPDTPGTPEGRLVVGILRDRPGGSCLLRWRSAPDDPLRGPDLAPGLVAALHATFED